MLRDYLGERFVEMFVSVKRTEQARFGEWSPSWIMTGICATPDGGALETGLDWS